MGQRRIPRIGWWVLATVPVVLLAIVGPFALDYYRVQKINAARDPRCDENPLECEARGPEWLQDLAETWGFEEYLQTRVTKVYFVGQSLNDDHVRQIPNTADIEAFILSGNQFTDNGLASLRRMPGLQALFLEDTEIGPGVSTILRHSPDIKNIICKRCSLTPDSLLGLPLFPALIRFHLVDVPFRSQDRLAILGSHDLIYLCLAGTEIDDDIAGLSSGLPCVRSIDFSRTRVGDTIAIELANMAGLTEINLSETAVTDRGVQALSALDGLNRLELSGISLTDQGTIDFDQLQSLRTLDLSKTKIADETARKVLSLPNLIRCDLSGTNITDSGLDSIADESPLDLRIEIADTAITDDAVARVRQTHPSWDFVRNGQSVAEPDD